MSQLEFDVEKMVGLYFAIFFWFIRIILFRHSSKHKSKIIPFELLIIRYTIYIIHVVQYWQIAYQKFLVAQNCINNDNKKSTNQSNKKVLKMQLITSTIFFSASYTVFIFVNKEYLWRFEVSTIKNTHFIKEKTKKCKCQTLC